ncbi:hypothetical protein BGZ94_005053, partial [Podila epigama]
MSSYRPIEIDDTEAIQFQSFSNDTTAPTGNLTSLESTPLPRQTGFGPASAFEPEQQRQQQQQENGANKPIWTLDYYARFFNVDTNQVMERCFASVVPKDNFLEVMGGRPDLYGPFWIPTTVIFILFVTGSIVDSINAYMNGTTYAYDIRQLTFAFATIYIYTFLVPLLVWGATKYFGCQPDLLEMFALYGYAMTIWIPVSVLSVLPYDLARWILIGIGSGLSGVFLIRNMWPVLSRAQGQTSKTILLLVILFHAVLGFLLKYHFFAYDGGAPPGVPPP